MRPVKVPARFFCLYLLGAVAASGTTLDDKVKAFEDALKISPLVKNDASVHLSRFGRILEPQDLEIMLQHRDNEMSAEGAVSQLMSTHPSEIVQQTGEDLLHELESQRKKANEEFEAKANAVLVKVPEVVRQAKKAMDLDDVLKDLQSLQNSGPSSSGYNATPELTEKINATLQFVTQWQDYLSALGSGNKEDARNSLRNILENRQIDAPQFFPRSEILARYVEASGGNPNAGNSTPEGGPTDPDVILDKVKKVDDVEGILPDLFRVPSPSSGPAWDWSELVTLDKAREDALAGLAVWLDLKKAMNGPVWGRNISRIVAMELLVLLPHYLGTDVSDPPKENETVISYLDRLSATANSNGNLALLQRAIAVKVALADGQENGAARGTEQFLAGLSQDAAGQYEPAVLSYENALKEPDGFLPVQIVGERLAAIKATHPDDFEKGLTAFMTPAATSPYPGYGPPPWMQSGAFGNPYANRISVLPIPMSISIPARTTAPSETSPARIPLPLTRFPNPPPNKSNHPHEKSLDTSACRYPRFYRTGDPAGR